MNKTIAVRLPRLLIRQKEKNGQTLREAGRLRPSALSVEMNLTPLSHAEMTLEEDDLPVQVHDLVELYGQNGSLGIFRAAQIETTYRKQRRIRLNHALDVLSDAVVPGEDTVSGTAAQVLSRILAAQTAQMDGNAFWTLGTVEDEAAWSFENKYTNALQCLIDFARAREDYCFSFDFSVFPWRLHFRRRDEKVLTEFRLSRNVERCQVTLDDSELCTRLYLSVNTVASDENGEKSEIIHEVYNDAAGQAAWGIVEKTAGINAADAPDRTAWARQYFARYGQPALQVTVDGMELNRITGERLDEMHLGRLCRVALPDYGAVFSERIVSVRYPDILRQPWRVTVEMANKKEKASGAFASLTAWRQSASRTMAATQREVQKNRYSLVAQDKHLTAQGEILHRAGLEIDPHGVWLFASEDAENYALGASFKVQADEISAEVRRAKEEEGTLSARISEQAGLISLKADSSTVTALGSRMSQAEIAIDGANAQIALKASQTSVDSLGTRVSAAEIAIDGANSAITLKADKVTVDAIQTSISNLTTGVTTAGFLKASTMSAGTLYLGGGTVGTRNITVDNKNLDVLVLFT